MKPDFEPPVSQPAPGTAQALAQRAASYANLMGGSVGKHTANGMSAGTDFPDPDALRLTAQPQADASRIAPPSANAAVTVQPTAEPAPVRPALVIPQPVARRAVEGEAPAGNTLAQRFAARAKDYPADLSAQFDQQMLSFLQEKPVPDLQSIAGLSTEDRELLSALMDSMTNFRNQLRSDSNMLFSKKIRPLVELADRLRSQAELSVPIVALCTSVKAYGVYDPIEPARFVAGQEHRVVVYSEVENFLSQVNDHNLYETRLTEDMVLYTESSGLPVWSDKRSTYLDQARHHRHDFFMGKIITLPSNLTIGRYLLKVTVEDQQAKHIAENTVPIEIVAR